MAVTHIGTTTAYGGGSASPSFHASAGAGDFALLRVDYYGQYGSVSPPTGWTILRNQGAVNSGNHVAYGAITFYRFLTAADIAAGGVSIPFAYTAVSSQDGIAASVSIYRGVDSNDPIGEETSGAVPGGTAASIGQLTTTLTDGLYVLLLNKNSTNYGNSTFTPPAGLTERADLGLDYNTYPVATWALAVYDKAISGSGTLGPFAMTQDSFPVAGWSYVSLVWDALTLRTAVPTITAITANSGPTGGGQTVTLTGTLLTGASGVTFGGTAATSVTVLDETTVTCVVPAHAAGAVDVVVTATAGSGTLAGGYTYIAPAITALSLARGSVAGGEAVTITGTNFAAVSGVTFGGTAATDVVLVSSTSITCRTPAHAAGAVDVVVTDAATVTATIAGGFTYLSAIDKVVKLVKGGVVSGNNKADTVTAWPASLTDASYGGSSDLWGVALTADDVNAATFGVVVQATLADGSKADIDYAEMTTYYTVTGIGDLPSLLCALTVDTDGQTTSLDVYELPRGNLGLANDPNANRAVSDAWFYSSRMFGRSRAIAKLWRELEFWLELLPTTNIPGFQVWAAADDGAFVQLRDGAGNAATISSVGAHRVFFPPDATATGHYVQLKLGIPATAGSEQKVAAKVRDMVLRGVWQPISSEKVDCTLVLSPLAPNPLSTQSRSVRQQEADLTAAQAAETPIAFTDIDGTEGYCVITDLKFRTVKFKEGSESVRLATLTLWRLLYE